MNRRERRAAARPQTKPHATGARTPAALYDTGLGHMQAGRYLDAQMCCEQALALDSSHADTFHLMGQLALQAKQHDLAVAPSVKIPSRSICRASGRRCSGRGGTKRR